jgi:glucokinase
VGLLVNVLDPEAIVVGGGLGSCEGLFWEDFIASTRRQIWSEVHRNLPILHAGTGTDAGLIGAATAAWQICN